MKCYLDATIMRKGLECTAGSGILEGFAAPFSASVVDKLGSAGVEIAGVAAADEFGIRPAADAPEPGALAAVADGLCDFALCNDHSGRVRGLAASRGLYYLHPTYGTVSRCGLVPAVSSMDQIGVLAKDAVTVFRALWIIAGHDPRDGASLPNMTHPEPENLPVGVYGSDFSLRYANILEPVHAILSAAEISGNIARFDGVKFGFRAEGYRNINELYLKTRSEAFGLDTKLTLVVGSMVLSAEYYDSRYRKAMQLRRLIRDELLEILGKFSAIRLPASITALATLSGAPSLTLPDGSQLIAKPCAEKALERLAKGGSAL